MPLPVSLHQFVNELDAPVDDCHVYLNRKTGEFLPIGPDDEFAADAEDEEDVPEWQRESLPKIREAMTSDDWLELPDKFAIDEYRIMERFAGTLDDAIFRADLLDTIGGRGNFGRFKNMLHRRGRLDDWYRFREKAYRKIAIDWLEANGIPFQD
jgi:hypothetical protein